MPAQPSPAPRLLPPWRRSLRALPPGIWVLGGVSMAMDISSELVHSLLPVYLVSVLGASMLTLGLIEGVAEATAALVKVYSGALSDALGRRKGLLVLGYGLGALSKLVFPLAPTVAWVFGARFVDRIGKGLRGAPRDALVADLVAPPLRGAAYGLRQALDSLGALLGPLLAMALMWLLAGDLKAVLWAATPPAALAMGLLVFGLREPAPGMAAARNGPALAGLRELGRPLWSVVALGAVFTLARFSEAFLVLRAQEVGLPVVLVPLVMIVMNGVYAGGAFPAGAAADRLGTRGLLLAGLAVLVLADLALAAAAQSWQVLCGAALWGLHMALTQGLFAKLVADAAPAALRGSAFGVFNLASGAALLAASVIAGALWQAWGSSATFGAGAGFAALAALGLARRSPLSRPA